MGNEFETVWQCQGFLSTSTNIILYVHIVAYAVLSALLNNFSEPISVDCEVSLNLTLKVLNRKA